MKNSISKFIPILLTVSVICIVSLVFSKTAFTAPSCVLGEITYLAFQTPTAGTFTPSPNSAININSIYNDFRTTTPASDVTTITDGGAANTLVLNVTSVTTTSPTGSTTPTYIITGTATTVSGTFNGGDRTTGDNYTMNVQINSVNSATITLTDTGTSDSETWNPGIFSSTGGINATGNYGSPNSTAITGLPAACPATNCYQPPSQLQGFFSADKSFIVKGKSGATANNTAYCNASATNKDLHLGIEGSVIVNAAKGDQTLNIFDNERTLCVDNNTNASVTFRERADLILNTPDTFKSLNYLYTEVAP